MQQFFLTKTHNVQQTDHLYSDQQLSEGFLKSDESVLQYIFLNLRPEILRAIAANGGSTADGNAFFLAAAADLSPLLLQGVIPENISFNEAFQQLALAHYRSWLLQRQPTAPPAADTAVVSDYQSLAKPLETADITTDYPDTVAEAPQTLSETLWLPADTALTETRKHIFVWKAMGKLRKSCIDPLLSLSIGDSVCRGELVTLLRAAGSQVAHDFTLPEWGEAALKRRNDYQVWEKLRRYEQNISRGLTIDGQDRSSGNQIAKYVFLFLLLATLGYLVYAWINQPKPAAEIFNDNFEPPESLLADINHRFLHDTSGIVRPDACEVLLKEADTFYAKKEYDRAMVPLMNMLDNEDLPGCRSDALFALGIVNLKREEPGEALQCLAKIDNIEAYGEDLYWYQSLAFVQLAKQSAGLRPVARKAVERFLENTRDEQRKIDAKKMLEQL